jgi:phage shock protein B
MTPVFIVSIVFGGIVLALTVICGTILMLSRLKHGGISQKNRQDQADEARMMQEIYHGLSKMEKRMDALESILMDQKWKDK